MGGCDGPFAVRNCRRGGAQPAVRRRVPERSIGPRAGNLLAGAGALRQAASLPKALRGLHGDRLLDRDAGAKVRLRKALSGPPIEAASSSRWVRAQPPRAEGGGLFLLVGVLGLDLLLLLSDRLDLPTARRWRGSVGEIRVSVLLIR